MNQSFSGEGHGGFIQAPPEPTAERGMKVNYHLMSDGSIVVECEQDVEPLIDAIQRGEVRNWLSDEKEMRATNEIPQAVIMEWAKQAGVSIRDLMMDEKLFNRFKNDPDFSKFRIPK